MPLEFIGTALGALGGLKKASEKSYSPYQQGRDTLRGAFRAADDAGIHRLAVAGSPAGYSPAPSSSADGLLAAGDAIRSHGTKKKQEELIDAQIEEARSRTVLNEANAKRASQGPQPGLGGAATAIQKAFDKLSNKGDREISREPERDQPGTQTVTLGEFTGRGPNPEAFEVGISELIAGALIYGPQWLQQFMKKDQEDKRSRPSQRDEHGFVISPRAGSG